MNVQLPLGAILRQYRRTVEISRNFCTCEKSYNWHQILKLKAENGLSKGLLIAYRQGRNLWGMGRLAPKLENLPFRRQKP